jgi:hypothetical protein
MTEGREEEKEKGKEERRKEDRERGGEISSTGDVVCKGLCSH